MYVAEHGTLRASISASTLTTLRLARAPICSCPRDQADYPGEPPVQAPRGVNLTIGPVAGVVSLLGRVMAPPVTVTTTSTAAAASTHVVPLTA